MRPGPTIFYRWPAAERRRALDALERVGLTEQAAKRADELSGGQQQRVAIARALINQPSLILADEPTGNLDSKSSVEIMSIFENLPAQGRTVVVVTHDAGYARTLRITTVRSVTQAFFFAWFVFLLWVTWLSRLGGYPASLFLELDPLVGFATALSTGTVYRWLWREMFVLVPTLLLGRVFCNWICPYGTLHQFVGWRAWPGASPV